MSEVELLLVNSGNKRLFKNKSEFWVVHGEEILSCRRGSIAGYVTEPKGKSYRQERVRWHFLSSSSVK